MRISEKGTASVRWLTSANYVSQGYFLAAIREGTVVLLQHSISTVFNPDTDGEKCPIDRLGLSRMFPSKIVMVTASLMQFTPPAVNLPWRLDSTLLVSPVSDCFLVSFPCENGLKIKQMRLFPMSQSPELSLPVAAPLGNHSVEELDPEKVRFLPFSFYLQTNEIWKFNVATGSSALFLSVSEGQALARNFALTFRPYKVSETYQFLIMKDVKGKRIATMLSYRQGQVTQTLLACHDAVLLGSEDSLSDTLLLLSESQDSVTALSLSTGKEKSTFSLETKLLKASWTPLASGYAVLYEVQGDHSLVLSHSALTSDPSDISLSSSLRFKLRFDEHVSVTSWHRTYQKLSVGTSLRILVLDHNLVPLFEQKHVSATFVTSLAWFGNTVLYTTRTGLFYCHGRDRVKVASTGKEAVILNLINDRVALLQNTAGEVEVQVRPIMLLEPLLVNYLSLPANNPDLVHRFIEKMDTNLVSETLISALMKERLFFAATFLIETHSLPQVSIRCKANAFLGARKLDALWTLLEANENDRESLKRGSAELHVLEELLPQLERLGQVSKIATVLMKTEKDSELAILMRETMEPGRSLHLPNPYIHLLTTPFGTPLPLAPRSTYDLAQISQEFRDRSIVPEPSVIKKATLGYKESAFVLKTNEDFEVYPISADTYSQWVGFRAVQEPGFGTRDIQPEKEGFPVVGNEGFNEEPEEGKLLLYLRLDEGQGETVADIVSGKTWPVPSSIWLEQLEDGQPLDYEDKWGKAASPSFSINCSEPGLLFTGLTVSRAFTLEFWVYFPSETDGNLFSIATLNFPLRGNAFAEDSGMMKTDQSECGPSFPIQTWMHLTLQAESTTWRLLLNTKLAFVCSPPKKLVFDSLKIGPFAGKVTELRIWSGSRSLSDLQENYKCPLDILSEKKKKAWSGITIKKAVSAASTTPAPTSLGLKIAPPGNRKFSLLLPPPSKLGTSANVQEVKTEDEGTSVVVKPAESGGEKPTSALDLDAETKEMMDSIDTKDYAEALLAVNKKLRSLAESIAQADISSLSNLQPQLQYCVSYKLALSLLLRIQSERSQSTREAQQRCAELCNLLIQLKIRPKHRIDFCLIALELNVRAGNYGIAGKIADQLIAGKTQLSDSQLQAISAEKTVCQANENRDNALMPCPCPKCGKMLPAGGISKRCGVCKSTLKICYLSYALVVEEDASQCPVCNAVYRLESKGIGEKCGFCGLTKVKSGDFATLS